MSNIKEQNPKQIESPGQEGEGWSAWGVDPMSRTPDPLVRCVLRGGRDPQRARCESRHPAARRQPSPEPKTLPHNRSPPVQYHPINPSIPKPIPFFPTTTITTNKLSPSHQTSNQNNPINSPPSHNQPLAFSPLPNHPFKFLFIPIPHTHPIPNQPAKIPFTPPPT